MPFQHTLSPRIATKQYYATDSLWEANMNYYRAIPCSPFNSISNATIMNLSSFTTKLFHPGNAKAQALTAFEQISTAVETLGGRGVESIVRTKMYVQKQDHCEAVAEASSGVLGKQSGTDVRFAATMIVVARFVDPQMLMEIECNDMVEDQECLRSRSQ
jgi:enamine deaminase RidA (YjgF/YER057c/UK114 family)